MGMIAEHATGAAAIATIALAGTSALGSLHAPGPPAAPTSAQSQAALVAVAHQPRPLLAPTGAKPHGSGCDTQVAEYSHCDSAPLRLGPAAAPRARRPGRTGAGADAGAGAGGEYGP
jgi:hypothetical protein